MGRNKFKKHDVPVKSRLKKDPGVPRLPDLAAKMRSLENRKARQTLSTPHPGPDAEMASEPTISSLAELTGTSASVEDEIDPPSSADVRQKTKEQARRHYVRMLRRVIDESDIILLVMDARDPEGCRSRLVEEEVRRRESEGKKLVFVLNKVDLVPKGNAQAWLRYLRHSTPTLPFRSASSHQRTNLSSTTAPALVRLLKAYKPSSSQSVTVGVVGYPNVGKSSLINSLKRAKVCSVAAQPGHTKGLQTIQLERGIKIVDSPGVVFDDDDFDYGGKSKKKDTVLLRNAIKVEDVEDPIALVEQILSRTDHELLKKIYNLPQVEETLKFLTMIALTTGRLLKGGTPDILAAARQVLTDWNREKIPYMSTPPTTHISSLPSTVRSGGDRIVAPGAENIGQAQILTGLSKPFTLDGLFGDADHNAFDAEMGDTEDSSMGVEQEEPMGDGVPDQDVIPMDDEESGMLTGSRKRAHSPPATSLSVGEPLLSNMSARQRKFMERDSGLLLGSKRRRTLGLEDVAGPIQQANPLNRRVLKKRAKRDKKAMNRLPGNFSGMDIDG
ncbi:P-loop containing nucleoside triphosphate hydrolase protein [Thelephora ganbajun]|uniref:P-loop containing nucleoside triphosphate hydrolase protein n=1 Tax=Thelephora ganbajun TaxID=370292 RepID=A0ACB6ZLH0_THEGA|nr:P-loop containing nucleoside triphosphate hydrolase protein [Thelephora ganbajun]